MYRDTFGSTTVADTKVPGQWQLADCNVIQVVHSGKNDHFLAHKNPHIFWRKNNFEAQKK